MPEAKALNLAAQNGADPAPPQTQDEVNEALQGVIDLRKRKATEFAEREAQALKLYTGQTDDPRTSKVGVWSSAHPSAHTPEPPAQPRQQVAPAPA